jgi:hypothetical protein
VVRQPGACRDEALTSWGVLEVLDHAGPLDDGEGHGDVGPADIRASAWGAVSAPVHPLGIVARRWRSVRVWFGDAVVYMQDMFGRRFSSQAGSPNK